MNILVTGSNSPLGSYLIRKLTNTFNDYEVFALSRGKYGPSLNNVKYFTHDLKKDTFSVNQSFDIVMHVASAVPAFTTNQKDFTLANLEGSKRLFENLTLNENATVLNISSTSVYDDPLSEILSEDSKKTSTNFYGISKLEFEISYLLNFFNSKYNIKIIYITFLQAFLSAIFSCIIAIPFALSLYRHKNSRIIKLIVSLCGYSFVIPSILIVYSVIGIYGRNGLLNDLINFYNLLDIKSLFGLKAILIAHILLNAPFATRLFFQNLNTIPKSYIEVANSLNLGFWSNLNKIEWPILKQNLFSVFSIIFVLCFLSFAIVMALGGGPSTSTMEVSIYQSALFELNFNKAIILSFIQMMICLILLIFGFYKLKGSNFFEIQTNYFDHPFKNNFLIKFFDYLIISIFSIILFSPIVYIISNFIETIYLQNYFLKKYFLEAFKNSVILSFLAAIMVTFFGLIISILLVNSRNNIFLQQILFLISSIILVI